MVLSSVRVLGCLDVGFTWPRAWGMGLGRGFKL